MALIHIELARNRDRCGSLTLLDAHGDVLCGPFPVAARATDALARLRNNPLRSPLLRFGDTPTGRYRIAPLKIDLARYPKAEFGPHGLIPLVPTAGDAACADANGRYVIAIFGGKTAANGSLRSTAGGLRLRDGDLATLVERLDGAGVSACDIIERADLPDYGSVTQARACRHDDPLVAVDAPLVERDSAHRAQLWARGAIALGVTVTFAAAPAAAQETARIKAKASPVPVGAAPPPARMRLAMLADGAEGYAPTAYNPPPASEPPNVTAPEPKTYAADVREVGRDVIKEVPTEAASQTVDILRKSADKMADASEAAKWKPAVSVLDAADTEFRISNYTLASTALEGVGNAFKLKSAYESGTRIGTAINDLQAGKIDYSTFVQKVGPEPAKILAANFGVPFSDFGVPFSDQAVDLTVKSLDHATSAAIDFGFDMYDKYKGYHIVPPPGDKK